jgi:hypothetical protein
MTNRHVDVDGAWPSRTRARAERQWGLGRESGTGVLEEHLPVEAIAG